MKKALWLVFYIFLTSHVNASNYIKLNCVPYGNTASFYLDAELDESGGNYIDGFIDFKTYQNGQLELQRSKIDSTGFMWLDEVDSTQVYIAELIPTNRSSFQFLAIAANHPHPTGNSYLRINGNEYQAECFIR